MRSACLIWLLIILGPGRTEWAWAGVPFGKGLPEALLPGRQLTRSRGPAREGGPHRVGLYPSALLSTLIRTLVSPSELHQPPNSHAPMLSGQPRALLLCWAVPKTAGWWRGCGTEWGPGLHLEKARREDGDEGVGSWRRKQFLLLSRSKLE